MWWSDTGISIPEHSSRLTRRRAKQPGERYGFISGGHRLSIPGRESKSLRARHSIRLVQSGLSSFRFVGLIQSEMGSVCVGAGFGRRLYRGGRLGLGSRGLGRSGLGSSQSWPHLQCARCPTHRRRSWGRLPVFACAIAAPWRTFPLAPRQPSAVASSHRSSVSKSVRKPALSAAQEPPRREKHAWDAPLSFPDLYHARAGHKSEPYDILRGARPPLRLDAAIPRMAAMSTARACSHH